MNIMMISTSEIKISCVIDEKYMELAMRALHTAFGLDQVPGGKPTAQ
ncbi:ACT domain-containing protein [Petrachloros mirabilis]